MREIYVNGHVAFCNLTQHEIYQGVSTNKYSITLMLDEDSAQDLSDAGVTVSEYKGQPKRKFTTTFEDFRIFNPNLTDWKKSHSGKYEREIPRGSKVHMLAKVTEEPYKNFGCSAYVDKVHVLSEASSPVPEGFQAVEEHDFELDPSLLPDELREEDDEPPF